MTGKRGRGRKEGARRRRDEWKREEKRNGGGGGKGRVTLSKCYY